MFCNDFTSIRNSDHVVASVSIAFSINVKTGSLGIAYDYSRADWNGLPDHLRDFLWEHIFKLSAFAAASEFYERVQVGTDIYIDDLIVIIRSSLTHLHGFQLVVLLP